MGLLNTHIFDLTGPALVFFAVAYSFYQRPDSPFMWLLVGMFGPSCLLAVLNLMIMTFNWIRWYVSGYRGQMLADDDGASVGDDDVDAPLPTASIVHRQSAFDAIKESEVRRWADGDAVLGPRARAAAGKGRTRSVSKSGK
eukprot:TRINITY_DN28210_c0_g1_i1.p1 TRINITY_DN28210_c0_g1~~TRINITY_DN28210_c0_g1_i1.p1  ORF type:complete len:141 (-),score=21.43 TRINITY_DN28210_c0_g1_i1:385-807(-)